MGGKPRLTLIGTAALEARSAGLPPCPFCGGSGVLSELTIIDTGQKRYYVRCRSCACEGPWEKTISGAKRAWSMRFDPRSLLSRAAFEAMAMFCFMLRRARHSYGEPGSWLWERAHDPNDPYCGGDYQGP